MSVCVHGLGYVGLATAALFANGGHDVTGFDTDAETVTALQDGAPATGEPALDTFVEQALDTTLTARDTPVPADYHIVCVPTPYDYDRGRADLTYVEAAGDNVAAELRPGDTVILQSTVPPGTTAGTFSQTLSASGTIPGRDVSLAYTPETILPGNTVEELRTNDRIVGGIDDISTDRVCSLYAPLVDGTVYESPDPTTAEFVKLAQNAARDVEIAYANTLARVAADYDINVRTAIELANNHPRVDILDPGPGVGGHCLPVDPLFLGRWSDQTELLEQARTVNDSMPQYVVARLEAALGSLEETTIAVLGVAYKGNVADIRHSPGLEIARRLAGETTDPPPLTDGGHHSIDVRIHDPHVSDSILRCEPLETAVDGADALVLTTRHDEFTTLDPGSVGAQMTQRVAVDPTGLLNRARWRRHGFDVVGL
jgi:UDP-N-acetyl-D-mannosaminuronic acid dehydrogenase